MFNSEDSCSILVSYQCNFCLRTVSSLPFPSFAFTHHRLLWAWFSWCRISYSNCVTEISPRSHEPLSRGGSPKLAAIQLGCVVLVMLDRFSLHILRVLLLHTMATCMYLWLSNRMSMRLFLSRLLESWAEIQIPFPHS